MLILKIKDLMTVIFIQLCLEMDSSSSSRTSGETSSSLESKREASGSSSSSFISFSHHKREPNVPRVHQHVTTEIQVTFHTMIEQVFLSARRASFLCGHCSLLSQEEPKSSNMTLQKTKNSSVPGKTKFGKSKTSCEKNKKTPNNLARRNDMSCKWPHLSLLGC